MRIILIELSRGSAPTNTLGEGLWRRELTLRLVRKSRSSQFSLFSNGNWSEETGQVRLKRLSRGERVPLPATRASAGWSIDFMVDTLADGHRLWTLNSECLYRRWYRAHCARAYRS